MKDLIRPYCNGNNNSEKIVFDLVGNIIAINEFVAFDPFDIFSVFLSGFNKHSNTG